LFRFASGFFIYFLITAAVLRPLHRTSS